MEDLQITDIKNILKYIVQYNLKLNKCLRICIFATEDLQITDTKNILKYLV